MAHSKPKLRTYVTFKDKLETSDYVNTIYNRSDRSILAKFRCGILQLHVESGRFNNTKLEDRLCKICNQNIIEDEFHFLCQCSEYHTERRNCLYDSLVVQFPEFKDLDDNAKFTYLMRHCNKNIIQFLKLSWDKRKKKLYK